MSLRRALRWLGIVLGVAVFVLVLVQAYSYRQALDFSWARVRWPALGLSALLFIASQALFALAWHRLLSDSGESGQWRGDIARWCVSLAGKYFPGKVWQAVARFGLYHGAERGRKVAPAFARETLLSLSAAMAIVAAHAGLDGSMDSHIAIGFSIGSAVLLLLCAPLIARFVVASLARWTPLRLEVPDATLASLVVVWLMQLLAYLLLGLGLIAVARGLGIAQPGSAWPVVAALCFAGLAGIAAFFVPAGIGVREVALAWYLAPYIGPAPAALLAVSARVWISLGEAGLVGMGLLMLRKPTSGTVPP